MKSILSSAQFLIQPTFPSTALSSMHKATHERKALLLRRENISQVCLVTISILK